MEKGCDQQILKISSGLADYWFKRNWIKQHRMYHHKLIKREILVLK